LHATQRVHGGKKNKNIPPKEVPRKMAKMVLKGEDKASIGVSIHWRYVPTISTYMHLGRQGGQAYH
jgi:hypothetical protein